MTRVFVDTSYYVALVSPRDALHDRAFELGAGFQGTAVTSEYVLVEIGNFLCHTGDRAVFVDLMNDLTSDPDTIILDSSHERFTRGAELYVKRGDKEWSLTDCISFVLMEELNLTDAFTSDHHFEQAGIRAWLK